MKTLKWLNFQLSDFLDEKTLYTLPTLDSDRNIEKNSNHLDKKEVSTKTPVKENENLQELNL
ncbi:MAG: hypothetical protein KDD58_13910 [Bdellovibrionales bacterium]|nr:hypothetical protein [Bdellovibrionales bacterium]